MCARVHTNDLLGHRIVTISAPSTSTIVQKHATRTTDDIRSMVRSGSASSHWFNRFHIYSTFFQVVDTRERAVRAPVDDA